jgi:hypothetical protein
MSPDLERLRRFALTAALILFTYLVADITPAPDTRIPVFGVPFQFGRPDLLPAGFALAAFYGCVKFYYYGMMLTTSPYRARRDALDALTAEWPKSSVRALLGKDIYMYFGATTFSFEKAYIDNREEMERRGNELEKLFPKFLRARVKVEIPSRAVWEMDQNGEPIFHEICTLNVTIPKRCRLAAFFEDADYTAPVWVNVLVVGFYGLPMLM